MMETASPGPQGLMPTSTVVLPISSGSWTWIPGEARSPLHQQQQLQKEPSKCVFSNILIANFLQDSPCVLRCVFISYWACSVGCLLLTLHQSLYHSLHISLLHPPISLSFLTPLQYLLLINIHGAKASLFLCGALKVILLKALLSVPATACELKVLICIHKITHEAMSSNC